MSVIVIKADNESNKILRELAERLGGNVTQLNEEQYEDLIMGAMMEKEKTGKKVSRERIFKKLGSR